MTEIGDEVQEMRARRCSDRGESGQRDRTLFLRPRSEPGDNFSQEFLALSGTSPSRDDGVDDRVGNLFTTI